MAAVLLEGEEVQTVTLGGYTFTVRGIDAFARRRRLDAGQQLPPPPPPPASDTTAWDTPPDTRPAGLIVLLAPGRFLFMRQGFMADPTRDGRAVEIDRVVEGSFVAGRWVPGRWLNGDQYGQLVPQARLGMTEVTLLP